MSWHSLACIADPCGEPVAQLGELGYAPLFRVIQSTLAVLRVAAQVEQEAELLPDWCRYAAVAEFGHLTSEQQISIGHAPPLITTLHVIRDSGRD